ncbi:MAG: polysaccharide deacetylase family protein [Candidatus Omnitrophica bacterium]|nr:polysaccharide deacetylase family protein [Candidatus Omnitrophota bacterium]
MEQPKKTEAIDEKEVMGRSPYFTFHASFLPILNYHGVEKNTGEYTWQEVEKPYVLSLTTFEKQLDYLSENGFTTLFSNQISEWVEGVKGYEHPLVLTFDDGHLSHYEHVAPLLKRKGFKGIFFISAGLVGQNQLMNWAQLKEMVRDGFEIGSHGFRHIPLSNLTHHELWKELQKSKKVLEDQLGIEVKVFSVPRGFYQLRVREVIMELGFRLLFTSRFDVNKRGEDPWRLNRIVIKQNTSFNNFQRFIQGNLGFKRVSERIKEGVRRFIKPSIYDSLADFKRILIRD